MDGLSFLEKLMKHYPIPVVVVSSLAAENSENALRALTLGAVEIVSKPGSQYSAPNVAGQLIRAIRTASRSRVVARGDTAPAIPILSHQLETTHKIIAFGASTGGTQAIERMLSEFPVNSPGTIVVQHMPPGFTNSFARRLNQICKVEVSEARDGDAVVPGVVLLAPGNKHMLLRKSGARYSVVLKDGPHAHFQKPSVDVMFQSVARSAGTNAVGVILTGMGGDGTKGMLEMRERGAQTIAQDEATCVVFGMTGEAVKVGAVDEILPLPRITSRLMSLVSQQI